MKINVTFIALTTLVMSLVWLISARVYLDMAGVVDTNAVDFVRSWVWSVAASFPVVLVIAWFVNRTHLTGLKLGWRVFFLLFGVMFFMTRIDTLMLNTSIEMPLSFLGAKLASGAVATLSVAILSVFYRRKLGRPALSDTWVDPSRNVSKLLLLAVIYMIFYFVFGYYTAWQVPGLREFYSGSTEILTIEPYLWSVLRDNISLPVFQIVRGLLWAGFGYAAIVGLGNARAWERIILVGLILSVPSASPLLVPNEFMPQIVRFGHFGELISENFLFGVLLALLFRPRARP